MTFWIITGALSVGVIAYLIFPLLRNSRNSASHQNFDAAIYKDQLTELDNDLQTGLVSKKDEQAARAEIQRRLIKSGTVGENQNAAGISNRIRLVAIALIVLLMPAGAYGLYLQLGIPEMPGFALADRGEEIRQANAQAEEMDIVKRMVRGLAEKLRVNPEDSEGWTMLGRSYLVLEQYEDSMKAYGQAYSLAPDSPDLAVDYAEARVFAGPGEIDSQSRQLFEQALEKNPDDFKARYYIALDLTNTKDDLPRAIAFWEALISESSSDAPWLDNLTMNHQRAKESM